MLMSVGDFCDRVEGNMAGLIDDLTEITGRHTESERNAWQRSLPKLSVLLSHGRLADFHVQVGHPAGISLEYQLPISSSWCDAVLLGRGLDRPSAVMIELKDWDVQGDQRTRRPGLVRRQGIDYSHPSDQVRGYVEYCRHFHSAVLDERAEVAGCAFFTRAKDVSLYRQDPYVELERDYPVFSSAQDDVREAFPDFLARHLSCPDAAFAERFEQGTYKQDRNLVRQVAESILSDSSAFYVLLDEQRTGFEVCLEQIEELLATGAPEEKAVVIVVGPPGSGKSVLAAKLWAVLAQDVRIQGDVVMTSTSKSQGTNWEAIFSRKAGKQAARGCVVGANKYDPGLSASWVANARKRGYRGEVETWHDNLKWYQADGGKNKMPSNRMAVSVVDEAHALIDPAAAQARGINPSGWGLHAGPQAWHIMRASRVSIFLMDGQQSYRDNETTTPERIVQLAGDLGITAIKRVGLEEAQFRCGGSKEYVDWVDHLLGLNGAGRQNCDWRRTSDNAGGTFEFEITADPGALEERLRSRLETGKSARLLASYSREWKTKTTTAPWGLPADQKDFYFEYRRDGQTFTWSRPWNYAPGQNYELFIQAPPGSQMHREPLSEVGCPYVVRGFDYDYVGLLWLRDLVWRGDRWRINPDQVFESALRLSLSRARESLRHQGEGSAQMQALLRRVQRGYRILLTRAIYGAYVWIEDEETRQHVAEMLQG